MPIDGCESSKIHTTRQPLRNSWIGEVGKSNIHSKESVMHSRSRQISAENATSRSSMNSRANQNIGGTQLLRSNKMEMQLLRSCTSCFDSRIFIDIVDLCTENCVAIIKSSLHLILYYILGCGCFYHFERWKILDSCYFITITVCTVGYGDFSPASSAGKIFAMFYIFYGLFLVIRLISSVVRSVTTFMSQRARSVPAFGPECAKSDQATKKKYDLRMLISSNQPNDPVSRNHAYRRRIQSIYSRCTGSLLLIIVMISIGAIFFRFNTRALDDGCGGDVTWLNAVYWCFVTVTMVGYGDMSLQTDSAKIFSIFYCWFAVILVSMCVGTIRKSLLDIAKEKKDFKIMKDLDLAKILAFDQDGNGVCIHEFTLGMLSLMEQDEHLNRKIAAVMELFYAYDTDKSGKIDGADLKKIAQDHEEKKLLAQKDHETSIIIKLLKFFF